MSIRVRQRPCVTRLQATAFKKVPHVLWEASGNMAQATHSGADDKLVDLHIHRRVSLSQPAHTSVQRGLLPPKYFSRLMPTLFLPSLGLSIGKLSTMRPTVALVAKAQRLS
jgi:hypothetical protein